MKAKERTDRVKMHSGQRRNSIEEGYFTVEAAGVLMIVLGVMVFLIFVLLCWYNRCLMDQETAMLAIKTQQMDCEYGELREVLSEWREDYIMSNYLGWKTQNPVISKSLGKTRLECSGGIQIGTMQKNETIAYENRRVNPVFFARLCRRVSSRKESK